MNEAAPVLAATDFSPAADRATWRAASVASTLGSILYLLHVLPPRDVLEQLLPNQKDEAFESLHAHAEELLTERARQITSRFEICTQFGLLNGRAHEATLGACKSLGASLVVIGAQGERDGVLPSNTIGDTALKIAGQSPVPLLLVRREAQQPYSHVVGCVKGDRADHSVVFWTSRVSPNDLIHIVNAYTVPYERRLLEWGASESIIERYATRECEERTRRLSQLLIELALPAARARLHVERGEPLQTILRTAAQWEADLIVVGRRTDAQAMAPGPFGSIARRVAFFASTDVMIVPPNLRAKRLKS